MAKNLLFEVSPLVAGIPTTIHLASASASKLGTHLDGYRWLPLINAKPTFEYTLASDGLLSETQISYGSLSFRMSELYDNEEWASWEWIGALGRIWFGNDGDPFESYEKIFEGSVSSITRDKITATIELLGPEALLDTPLLSLSYAGTGDVEGDTTMEGNLKPRAFGECLSIAPVCIDQAYQIYQVNGYGPVAQLSIYVFAEALTQDQYLGDVADYAALAALTVDPGKFATCFAHGLFRLGAVPTKKLSADVVPTSSLTLDKIIPEMLAAAGIPSALIGDMSAVAGMGWSLYQTEDVSVGDAIRSAVQQAGCYLFATPDGKWNVGNYFDDSKPPVTLTRDRSSLPLVRSITELNSAAPVYEVKIGYDKCWNVHDDDDVSPILAGLSDEQTAALAQATENAAQAIADAQVAAARLAAMESDGILDRSEKARILRDFESKHSAAAAL
ncbi:hypothetical protein [Sphingomonas oryzagri]